MKLMIRCMLPLVALLPFLLLPTRGSIPPSRLFVPLAPSPIEPFPWLHGGSFSAPAIPFHPDPLATYEWFPTTNSSELQVLKPLVLLTKQQYLASVNLTQYLSSAPQTCSFTASCLCLPLSLLEPSRHPSSTNKVCCFKRPTSRL